MEMSLVHWSMMVLSHERDQLTNVMKSLSNLKTGSQQKTEQVCTFTLESLNPYVT